MPAIGDVRLKVSEYAKDAVHVARRVHGLVNLRNERVEGIAGAAVLEAARASLRGRATPTEAAWVHRIETIRKAMLASVQPLEIVDFGAGKAAELGPDDTSTVTTDVRTLGQMTLSSKSPRWALMLFHIVRQLRPVSGIELGSCVGVSAAYQGAAMELNGNGRLLSLEGSPSLVARSNRTVEDVGLGGRVSIVEGPFNQTLESALRSIEPVQYAFIDGHHIEVATVDYMETILTFVDREAVLVFDDINWSDGMRRAWARVRQDSRFSMFVDFGNVGIGVVSAADNGRRTIEVPYG